MPAIDERAAQTKANFEQSYFRAVRQRQLKSVGQQPEIDNYTRLTHVLNTTAGRRKKEDQ